MKLYMYDARIEPGDEGGEVVTFPDVPEAVTEGNDRGEALSMAADALGVALLTYARQGRALPERRVRGRGLVPVAIEPDVAAKLAVMEAFSRARITKTELAARLGRMSAKCAGSSTRSIRRSCRRFRLLLRRLDGD